MIPHRPRPSDVRSSDTRGARSNPDGRFEAVRHDAEDDGWGTLDRARRGRPGESEGGGDDAWEDPCEDPWGPPPSPRTRLEVDHSRAVLTRNRSPDVPFDRSVNLYRGCEHGCIYCYARPTHAYLGLSPGLDFETRLFHKPDAAAQLEAALRKPGYRPAPIAFGTNTDPYQPVERRLGLMRQVLGVLSAFHHPLTITTKSALVDRDLDLLADMAGRRLVAVALSITTLDRDLARRLEPRASPPAARLRTIRRLSEAGVPAMVLVAPVIPGLTDAEVERILESAAGAGARQAGYTLVRLPGEVEGLFREWLEAHAPDRARRVMSLIDAHRTGSGDPGRFHVRMRGAGEQARLLARRFAVARARLGLSDRAPELACDRFAPPPRPGDQLRLL
nr:PA0069 family radical SAM protein [Roseospira visakhapatnamensis]